LINRFSRIPVLNQQLVGTPKKLKCVVTRKYCAFKDYVRSWRKDRFLGACFTTIAFCGPKVDHYELMEVGRVMFMLENCTKEFYPGK
jgi:hypothetical protein